MNQTSYLSLFIITCLLIGGITPSTLAFADEDKLKLEIEKEDGITKIEIKTGEKEIELKLEDADNELIVNTILQYVDLPDDVIEKLLSFDDSEFEFEYEHENEFAKEDEHEDNDEHEESDKSEALEAIDDAIEEIEETIQRLQHAIDAGIETGDAEEIIVKAKTLVNDADAAFELGDFEAAEDLADHAEDLAKEAQFILGDVSDDFDGDSEEQEHLLDDSDNTFLEQRIDELENENKDLREQITELEQKIQDLNAVLMEQLKVIYEWILNR